VSEKDYIIISLNNDIIALSNFCQLPIIIEIGEGLALNSASRPHFLMPGAVHSTYWHNNYGELSSRGSVNAVPEAAYWIFRGSTPLVSYDPGDITVEMLGGTQVDVVESLIMRIHSDANVETSIPESTPRWSIFLHSVVFVLGFSFVFVVGWGGAATIVGSAFVAYKSFLAQIGGGLVILFGLFTMDVVNIPWFQYDTRPFWTKGRGGWLSSGIFGAFFAAGWTPCIGVTLGSILTLGMSQDTSGQAMVLSSGYALGLGVPFLLLGLATERGLVILHRFKPHMRKINIISGLFLILIGVMMLTNQIMRIAIWAQGAGLYLDVVGSGLIPTYPLAMAAGLLSFLSPCVLPLVPAYLGYLSGQALPLKGKV
jgi:cytochrome c-type biogenesis protein